jgi:predicted nucleic acid-binding protein
LIYLDTSVALAHLFGEGRVPREAIWREYLVASRLLQYELWNRIHARGLTFSHSEQAKLLLSQTSLIDLTPTVLNRALQPFPLTVRTSDGLHLATAEFLRASGEAVELASYDRRLVAGARELGIAIYAL